MFGKDGQLHYPHPFSVGNMVKFKPGNENLNGFIGLGIITDTSLDDITVYWQNNAEYKKYTVAAAVLSFTIIP